MNEFSTKLLTIASGLLIVIGIGISGTAHAASGPLGIDHRLPYDDSGIWARHNQLLLQDGVILTELGGALWLGGKSRLGNTFWRSLDSSAFAALTVQGMKYAFGRERPSQTDNPNQWFKNGQSFPSGEVALQASFITPFIMEYRHDHPWVWGLELLPAYDGVARMKVHGHWQTDVLAGWAVGTLWGVYAHDRKTPFFLSVMPHGIMVGLHTSF
ncbi:MAG TPA: phosphatase PAP2 family protein [Gammaproteobacteria bacterium]|nr:phosphatase PAP2 family protein [Gammaproteobacteria bacterium]